MYHLLMQYKQRLGEWFTFAGSESFYYKMHNGGQLMIFKVGIRSSQGRNGEEHYQYRGKACVIFPRGREGDKAEIGAYCSRRCRYVVSLLSRAGLPSSKEISFRICFAARFLFSEEGKRRGVSLPVISVKYIILSLSSFSSFYNLIPFSVAAGVARALDCPLPGPDWPPLLIDKRCDVHS